MIRSPMALDMRDIMEMPDDELLALWREQQPQESGSDAEQDVLAAELERRGLDV